MAQSILGSFPAHARARALGALALALLLAMPAYATESGDAVESWPAGDGSRVDVTGPLGGDGWFTGAVTVTIDDSDAKGSVRYRVDGAAWVKYEAPFQVSGDGAHLVEFGTQRSINHGETGGARFRVDATPPASVAAVNGARTPASGDPVDLGWFGSGTNLIFNAEDALAGVVETAYRLNDGAWTTYTDPVGVDSEGRHEAAYRSTDAAGNVEDARTVTWGLDFTPPVTTAGAPCSTGGDALDAWCNGTASLRLASTDAGSGTAATWFSVEGDAPTTYEAPVTFTADGTHEVTFASEDAVGNAEDARHATVRVDATPPEVASEVTGELLEDGRYAQPANVTITAADALAGVATLEAAVGDDAFALVDGPIHLDSGGVHEVRVRATDDAGNVNLTSFEVHVAGDGPVTEATLAGIMWAPGKYGPVDVTLTVVEDGEGGAPATTEYALNDAAFTPYEGPFTVAVDGTHVLRYRSTDPAGNPEEVQFLAFTVDATPPTTRLLVNDAPADPGETVLTRAATLRFDASDDASGAAVIEYRIGEAPWRTYEDPIPLAEDGAHEVRYRSMDLAGNHEAARLTHVLVDATPPEVAVDVDAARGENGWFLEYPAITLQATDTLAGVAHVEYAVNDAPLRAYGGAFVLEGAGVHEVTYRAADTLGNEAPAGTLQVPVDLAPPVTTADMSGERGQRGWYTSPVDVGFTATDDASGVAVTQARFGSDAPAPADDPLRLDQSGSYRLGYSSVDAAGRAEREKVAILRLDLVTPGMAMTVDGARANESGDAYAGPVTVAFESSAGPSRVADAFYRVNGGAWEPVPEQGVIAVATPGRSVVDAFTVNRAGVQGPVATASFVVLVEGTHWEKIR